MAMAGLKELAAMNCLMGRVPPGEAAYRTLVALDPSTPAPTPEILEKAKQVAVLYYAHGGPASTECPYLRERAWLHGYASVCGVSLSFPHVENISSPKY